MVDLPRRPRALLLDIDGVLHVGDEPLPGAHEALAELRALVGGRLRLVTNTTSKSRGAIVDQLRGMGFELDPGEVLTPAALAVAHCREAGHARVALLVGDSLREDLTELPEAGEGEEADAVVVGDDVEGDVGGGLDGGIASVLVRTGKYSEATVAAAGISPTAIVDSIADLPGLLGG